MTAPVQINNINAAQRRGDDNRKWNYGLLCSVAGSVALTIYQLYKQKTLRNEMDSLKLSFERERREDKAMAVIHEIRRLLFARQEIICSNSIPYFIQRTREEELRSMVTNEPIAQQLNIKADLNNIFHHPTPCSRSMINQCVEDWQRKVKDLLNNKQK